MPVADAPPVLVRAGDLRATLDGRRIVVRRDGRRTLTAVLGPPPGRPTRVERDRVTRRFTTPSGKRRRHVLRARRVTVRYAGGRRVEVLAARDGVAFRTTRLGDARLVVPGTRWLQPWRTDYENPYVRGLNAARIAMPALFRHRGTYTLVTESGAARDAVSRLDHRLQLQVPPGERAPRTTPWRIAVTGALADVVETDLPLTLGRPSRIADPSWIEPGKAAWSWWSDRDSPRSLDAQKAAVDRAAAHGWRYVTVDEGWDPAWVPALVAYARERGVKVVVWFDVDDPVDFAQLRRWGVAGVKLDFVLSDRAKRIRLMDDLARRAARHRMVVNFHGCTVPRGIQRRWPNVLTLEAVKGGEYFGGEPADPRQNVNYVFTRNVVGGMDYTPVTLNVPGRVTSDAHELALSVVFESGLQHFPDTYPPAAQAVLDAVPVAWDDTRLLGGRPDDHAIVARREGATWWVGGINAGKARTMRVPLSFLGRGDHTASLVTEGLQTSTQTVRRTTVLRIPVAADGGFVAAIR